jgi:hypothetical protein
MITFTDPQFARFAAPAAGLQPHLVLETSPGFSIILYWKRLGLAPGKQVCYPY